MTKPHILNPRLPDCWHSRDWPSRIPLAEHLPQRHAGPQSAVRASRPSCSSCQNRTGNPNIRNLQSAICNRLAPPSAPLRPCVSNSHILQPRAKGASSILKNPEIGTHLPLPLCFMRHFLRLKILENPNFFATPPFLGRRAIPLPSPANPLPLLLALRALGGVYISTQVTQPPIRLLTFYLYSTRAKKT